MLFCKYKYINNNYDIKLEDFLESYNKYLLKNHHINFPKNYIYSFIYTNNLYELYIFIYIYK
jgi:hypothetical protein